jgi:serine/threonine-protein kinase
VGGSYILLRPIGSGATGVVWRGVDRGSGEPVAVKLLHDSLPREPALVTRFAEERTILLMLRNRYVARVRDRFTTGESLGQAMDLIPGGSLREHLRAHGPIPAAAAARLAVQVASALAEAHELGIVHRDLKPGNILLHLEGGRPDARLTDFGIAPVLTMHGTTSPNAVVGTPHYMSPETFQGAQADPAADVYALGAVLYELVTGRPPYLSDSISDLRRRHLAGNPERPPGIPDELWTVITSCLARKPLLRPAAPQLTADLSAVAATMADAAGLPSPHVVPSRRDYPSATTVPAPRTPGKHNQTPGWRWRRPGVCGPT